MKNSRFDNVIIIGQSIIAKRVFNSLFNMQDDYGYELSCIVHENINTNVLGIVCKKMGIKCTFEEDKDRLTDLLLDYQNEKNLIISAYNNYWFPKRIVDRKAYTIINYHNSLLPKYQGGNAITWAIFNKESKTGATWHYVTSKADNGNIIWQGEFEIKADAKAYEISRESMKIAGDGFAAIIDELMEKELSGVAQLHKGGQRDLHYFKDLPMDGIISKGIPVEDCYRLLRAMDYGKNSDWPKAKYESSNGKRRDIKSYRLVDSAITDDVCENENIVYLKYNEEKDLKIVLDNL